jgi:ADP-heptose:LPS heptosyltransferase
MLIIGTERDKETLEKIIGNNKNSISLYNFNLRHLYPLYKQSQLVITNDGAPMYIAWTSGVRVIGLFAKYPEKLKEDILKGKKLQDILKKYFH